MWVCVYLLVIFPSVQWFLLSETSRLFIFDILSENKKIPIICSHFTKLKGFPLLYRFEVICTSGHFKIYKMTRPLNISLDMTMWWNVLQATHDTNCKLKQAGNLYQNTSCWGQCCCIFNVPLNYINWLYFEILKMDFKHIWKDFFT